MLSSTLSMGFLQIPQPGGCPGPAAGRGLNTRAGYLAKAQHQMLPAAWRHSPTANTIGHRGPGQQPEVITGELTTAITPRRWPAATLTPSDQASHAIGGHR